MEPSSDSTVTTTPADAASFCIGAARVGKLVPDAYRLVTKGDGSGNTVYVLQGLFTWTQGWSSRGGEWRDLETQDWLTAQDSIPFGPVL